MKVHMSHIISFLRFFEEANIKILQVWYDTVNL